MAVRDYESAPVSEQLGIPHIIAGLVDDLEELRAGKISVNDAVARSMLAKQIFNGVRIYLNGARPLSDRAVAVGGSDERALSTGEPTTRPEGPRSDGGGG